MRAGILNLHQQACWLRQNNKSHAHTVFTTITNIPEIKRVTGYYWTSRIDMQYDRFENNR